jgi:acyl dehydratase
MIESGKTLYFEDVAVGDEPPKLVKGPLTTVHLMRWSASIENWHKIHYDHPFATGHDKLPGCLIAGSMKQQFLVQILKDWIGEGGWVWKVGFQFRAMNVAGETLTTWGKVKAKHEFPDYGVIELELGIVNEAGKESTPGTASVALPYRGGKGVPYPFVPPAGARG